MNSTRGMKGKEEDETVVRRMGASLTKKRHTAFPLCCSEGPQERKSKARVCKIGDTLPIVTRGQRAGRVPPSCEDVDHHDGRCQRH